MKFDDWCAKNPDDIPSVRDAIGVTRQAIHRYRTEPERIPDREVVIGIYVATDGDVCPNDWYDLPKLRARRGPRRENVGAAAR